MRRTVLFIIVLCLWAVPALSADLVGSVKTLQGEAWIVRGGQQLPAGVGDEVKQNDLLKTGDGSMGVLFHDDTSIALGPRTEILIDEFVFDPAAKNTGFSAEMLKGTALFVTGQIAKIEPESFKVRTPMSTIGIRGTKFLLTVP